MIELIKKFKSLSFENRNIFSAKFSIIFNLVMAIGKFLLSFFFGFFFFVAGGINIFIMLAKRECYCGIKNIKEKTFEKRNLYAAIFLIIAGLCYSIYMGRMLIADLSLMKYNMILGIMIACVSFVEMTIAVIGCFKVVGKGHYFRNLKIINLCSAFTAIVLTEVALMSFASETDSRVLNAIFGLSVGLLIIILGVFIIFAPRISIVDKEHNVYRRIIENDTLDTEILYQLTFSKVCSNFYYKATKNGDILDGHIIKGKSPIASWNIYVKILIIVLSEILIFVYAVWQLIFYFKNANIIKKLDIRMKELGYEKTGDLDD